MLTGAIARMWTCAGVSWRVRANDPLHQFIKPNRRDGATVRASQSTNVQPPRSSMV